MAELNQAEKELYFTQMGMGGSFSTSLFELIMNGDRGNQAKLALGFPDEVEAVLRYQNEPGYWQYVQDTVRG